MPSVVLGPGDPQQRLWKPPEADLVGRIAGHRLFRTPERREHYPRREQFHQLRQHRWCARPGGTLRRKLPGRGQWGRWQCPALSRPRGRFDRRLLHQPGFRDCLAGLGIFRFGVRSSHVADPAGCHWGLQPAIVDHFRHPDPERQVLCRRLVLLEWCASRPGED